MQDILSPDEIKRRCEAIRLTPEELARRANVAGSTAHRLGKSDNRVSTRSKMTRALIAEESRLFQHLFGMYRDEPRT